MTVYRLAAEKYHDDLSGNGAKLYGGRWNEPGLPALYCTDSIALAVLEILVRTGLEFLPPNHFLLTLQVPEKTSLRKISLVKLKQGWKHDLEYTQWMGTEFLRNNKYAVLEVPSAIVDASSNFLLNPLHPDYKKISLTSSQPFEFDKRLFLKNE
ncbi:MAG: RES family NAD+ phosphorylase [Ferruginibacter sp.]